MIKTTLHYELLLLDIGSILHFSLDTFDDEGGRDAHLNGKAPAALMEKVKAGDLFAKEPEIHKFEILADKLPK